MEVDRNMVTVVPTTAHCYLVNSVTGTLQGVLRLLRCAETGVEALYDVYNWKPLLLCPPSTNFRNMLDFMMAAGKHRVR
jgi:hypothetical protein